MELGVPCLYVYCFSMEVKVPKLKTKSSAKKRFSFSANGNVIAYAAFRRHNLRKRSQKMKRQSRGAMQLEACDNRMIHRLMPYS